MPVCKFTQMSVEGDGEIADNALHRTCASNICFLLGWRLSWQCAVAQPIKSAYVTSPAWEKWGKLLLRYVRSFKLSGPCAFNQILVVPVLC